MALDPRQFERFDRRTPAGAATERIFDPQKMKQRQLEGVDVLAQQTGKWEREQGLRESMDKRKIPKGIQDFVAPLCRFFLNGDIRATDIVNELVVHERSKRLKQGITLDAVQEKQIEKQIFTILPKNKEEGDLFHAQLRKIDEALANEDYEQAQCIYEESGRIAIPSMVNKNPGYNKSLQAYLRCLLELRTSRLVDDGSQEAVEQFGRLFEGMNLVSSYERQGESMTHLNVPVNPTKFKTPEMKAEILAVLQKMANPATKDERLPERMDAAINLGILTLSDIPADMARIAAEMATRKGKNFEKTAHTISDTGAPLSDYPTVTSDSEVYGQTIEKLKQAIEGGSRLDEWFNRILNFDATIRREMLEPWSALPAGKKKEDLRVLDGIDGAIAEAERLRKPSAEKARLSKLKSDLETRYAPAVVEGIYAPYRRVKSSDFVPDSDLMKHVRKVLKSNLTAALRNRIADFVVFRENILKERKSSYWRYSIFDINDFADPTFQRQLEDVVVERLGRALALGQNTYDEEEMNILNAFIVTPGQITSRQADIRTEAARVRGTS